MGACNNINPRVVCHPVWTQRSCLTRPKTLPCCPTQFLAHYKAHKANTQKPTLQRAKNANAQTHPPPSRQNSYYQHQKAAAAKH